LSGDDEKSKSSEDIDLDDGQLSWEKLIKTK
jgi:hypothetical protein